MQVAVLSALLTPVERRTMFTVCAPDNMEFAELSQINMTSVNAGNFERQLPEFLGKIVLIGTSELYLDKLSDAIFNSSEMEEIWKLVVRQHFTIGELEDLFTFHDIPRDVSFIMLPAWPCANEDVQLKYLLLNSSVKSFMSLAEARIIETFFKKYFNGREVLSKHIDGSGSVTLQTLSQNAPLFISNPFGEFTEFMIENIRICVISESGTRYTNTNCLLSLTEPRFSLREKQSFIPGYSEVELINILSALQTEFIDIRTIAIKTIIGTMARLNQFVPNSNLLENRYELGYGLGILSKAHLHRMIFSGEYNRVAYFKYNEMVEVGFANISNEETVLKKLHKAEYASYMCQKITIIFKSIGNSDPYDASEEKQFFSNATDLSALEGYNVWVYVKEFSSRRYSFLGTINRSLDGQFKISFVSRQNFGNPIDENVTLLVCTATTTSQLVFGRYEVPKQQFKAAIYISSFPRYINIRLINTNLFRRHMMYLTVSVNIPEQYETYLTCFSRGNEQKYVLGIEQFYFLNQFVKEEIPNAKGFCRIYVCPNQPGVQYGLEFEMTDVCGVSSEFRMRTASIFSTFILALCSICIGSAVFAWAGILVSDQK